MLRIRGSFDNITTIIGKLNYTILSTQPSNRISSRKPTVQRGDIDARQAEKACSEGEAEAFQKCSVQRFGLEVMNGEG